MNRKLKHKTGYEDKGKPLTLSQCRQQMFTSLFLRRFLLSSSGYRLLLISIEAGMLCSRFVSGE